jgi:polysaccharide biosynthesis transport protein
MNEKIMDMKEVMRILKRRKYSLLIPFMVIFLSVATVSMLLPSIYKSSATILIEAQNIPDNFVTSTVTGYVEERLQTITQVVLSRVRLQELIDQLDLYREMRGEVPMEEVVTKMRRDIQVESIKAEVINPKSGRTTAATVAFNISYRGKNPQEVARVTSELSSLFLQENLKNREQKTRRAVEFLEEQANSLRVQIQEKEQSIADFKRKHLTALPELVNLNMQTAERLDKDIASHEEQLRTLQNRKVYLEGQLATIDPGLYGVDSRGQRMSSPSVELETLRREYVSMRATLSENHPDVQRIMSRIEALEQTYGSGTNIAAIHQLVGLREDELEQLQKRYSEAHPDVVSLKKEIATLNQQAEALEKKGSVRAVIERQPDNPAYINIRTQLASTEMDIEETKRSIAVLKARYEDYRRRLEQTPGVEHEFRILRLDYDNTQEKYKETITRLQGAREAMVLEESDMAEKMTLISPATVPETPDSPNRLALVLVGLVLSLGGGIAFGSLAEFLDRSVYSDREFSELSSVPILAGIPYLNTRREQGAGRRRKILYAFLIAAAVLVLLLGVHLFVEPLDGLLQMTGESSLPLSQ